MSSPDIVTTIILVAAFICACHLFTKYVQPCCVTHTHTHTHTTHTHTHTHTHTNEPPLFSRTSLSAVFVLCSTVTCDCPPQPFPCPRDSILVERRLSSCCVQYECVCPHAACPVLAECDSGVQPVPMQRGHGYPGYCCPQYQFEGVQISYTYVCV